MHTTDQLKDTAQFTTDQLQGFESTPQTHMFSLSLLAGPLGAVNDLQQSILSTHMLQSLELPEDQPVDMDIGP